jgi:hypothetical protein
MVYPSSLVRLKVVRAMSISCYWVPQDVMRCDRTYFGFPDAGEASMASAFLASILQVTCGVRCHVLPEVALLFSQFVP